MLSIRDTFENRSTRFWNVHPSQIAHLVIDCQKQTMSTELMSMGRGPDAVFYTYGTTETESTAEKIATQAPKLGQTGILTGIAFSTSDGMDIDTACGGLHKLSHQETYLQLPKTDASLFKGSDAETQLKDRGIKNLLISGANISICVYETVMDGLAKDFNIALMSDLITENQQRHSIALVRALATPLYIKRMEKAGALMTDSDTALSRLQNQPQLVAA